MRHEFSCRFLTKQAALTALAPLIDADATDIPPDGWFTTTDGQRIYWNLSIAFGSGSIPIPDGVDAGGLPKTRLDPFWIIGLWYGDPAFLPAGVVSAKANQSAIRFG